MKVHATEVPGVLLVEPQVYRDDRGFSSSPSRPASTPRPGLRPLSSKTTTRSRAKAPCAVSTPSCGDRRASSSG